MEEGTAVVFDTTVLSNFSSVQGGMDYLTETIDYPVTALMVYRELEAGDEDEILYVKSALDRIVTSRGRLADLDGSDIPDGKIHAEAATDFEVRRVLNARLDWENPRGGLDPGEAHALWLCCLIERLPMYDIHPVLATDDMAARDAAEIIGFDITGSIGLLARAVKRGDWSLSRAEICHKHWVENLGFYSPVEKIKDVLPDDDY